MPNNIQALRDDLAQRQVNDAEGRENFEDDMTLTEDEQARLDELDVDRQTVVVETTSDGSSVSTPMKDYAAPLDDTMRVIRNTVDETTERVTKLINQGDIKQTTDDLVREGRERALRAFQDMAIGGDGIPEDQIIEINNSAIEAVRNYLRVSRVSGDDIRLKIRKLSLRELTDLLPRDFVNLYTTEAELSANNYKAKERLIGALDFLTATGPDLDYINEYIDREHRLTEVSKRIIQCQLDYVEMLKSPDKLSDIAAKAQEFEPADDSVWSKYVAGDPKRLHSEFSQKSIIYDEYVAAYTKLLDEYDDPESRALVQEQIDESRYKAETYRNVCNLELFSQVWSAMDIWLRGGKKNSLKRIDELAFESLDRIRRSKQDLPFPTYNPALAKRPKEQYEHYLTEFSAMLRGYNSQILKVMQNADDEQHRELVATGVEFITIDGQMEDTVYRHFAMLLLIAFGRITKKLTSNTSTKYDAIMLDAYFRVYCKMGTDIYIMQDIWNTAKELVQYSIEHWNR